MPRYESVNDEFDNNEDKVCSLLDNVGGSHVRSRVGSHDHRSCDHGVTYIFYCNYIGIAHDMLRNLRFVLFFVCSVMKSFKKVLMCRLVIGGIVNYHTTIIPNTLNKMADCMKFRIVKD